MLGCCVWQRGENGDAFCDSLGFTATTAAVLKSGPALLERDNRAEEGRPCCSWNCLSLQSASRSYFRDAFFASFALKWVKLAEVVIWVIVGLFSLLLCNRTEPFSLAKRALIQWVSNFAFAFINFIGFCFPKIGIKLYGLLLRFVTWCDPLLTETLHARVHEIRTAIPAIERRIGREFPFLPAQVIRQ